MSMTVTRKFRSNKKRYTSRLQKGGALLEDMRVLLRNWSDEGTWNNQRDRIIRENILSKKTRSRAIDVYKEALPA